MQSDMVMQSGDDPFHLGEPRAVWECSFAACSFSAPGLYNQWPLFMKGLNSVESFKKRLKTFLFAQLYDHVDGVTAENFSLITSAPVTFVI